MSNLQSALVIIMAEVCIMLMATLGYIVYRYIRKHRGVMSALHALTSNINKNSEARSSMLHEFLTKTCQYSDEAASAAANELIEKEQSFYNSLIEIYATQNQNALASLDSKTEEVISAYRELASNTAKIITQDAQSDLETQTQQFNHTIEDLKEKNNHLSVEVNQLKHEMDLTVQEYSSAFRDKPESKLTSGKTENAAQIEGKDEASTDTENSAALPNEITVETSADQTQQLPTDNTTDSTAAISDTTASQSPDEVTPSEIIEEDDSVEPEFETHSINEAADVPLTNETSVNQQLDDEIKADLEALTAEFDSELTQTDEDIDLDISLDELDDDASNTPVQNQAAQR